MKGGWLLFFQKPQRILSKGSNKENLLSVNIFYEESKASKDRNNKIAREKKDWLYWDSHFPAEIKEFL